MSDQPRTCHTCGTHCGAGEFCPTCVAAFPNRRDAETMTGAERAAEMEDFAGPVEVPFDLIHGRIEELVDRPVWTHEMGLNWRGLVEEARTRQHPTLAEVVDLVPSEKRIVVTPDSVQFPAGDPETEEIGRKIVQAVEKARTED